MGTWPIAASAVGRLCPQSTVRLSLRQGLEFTHGFLACLMAKLFIPQALMMTGEVAVPFVANSLQRMSSLGTSCFYTEVASADLSQARKLLSTAVMEAALICTD